MSSLPSCVQRAPSLPPAAQAGRPIGAHIFIDNSNIFEGARRAAETREPDVPRGAVRLYYRNFFRLVEDGVNPLTRVLAGSGPAGSGVVLIIVRVLGAGPPPRARAGRPPPCRARR